MVKMHRVYTYWSPAIVPSTYLIKTRFLAGKQHVNLK
jgi:hypothetical protein